MQTGQQLQQLVRLQGLSDELSRALTLPLAIDSFAGESRGE